MKFLNPLITFSFILIISNNYLLTGQRIWEKLENMPYFQPEDIEISYSGNIYVSVLGQNKILESKDNGLQWKNIVKDTFLYNSILNQKTLLVDHNDSLIEFFQQAGLTYPRYYVNDNFILDTLSNTQNANIGQFNSIKFDNNGNYYYFDYKELRKYKQRWFDSEIVFNDRDRISNYFVYSDSVNYVITIKPNGTYNIYKFNSKTGSNRLLVRAFQPFGTENIIITESGNILNPTALGLYLSKDEGKSSELITFDSTLNPKSRIEDLRFTLLGHIVLKSNGKYYLSVNQGEDWTILSAFNNSFPNYNALVKFEIFDSTLAIMMINQKCDVEQTYILRPSSLKWELLTAEISVLSFNNLTKNSNQRLYASDNSCEIVFSDNESKNWKTYLIESQNLEYILNTKDKISFAITKKEKYLFKSIDDGDNWVKITDTKLGIPRIEILSIQALKETTFILKGGIRDSGQILYKDTFYFITINNGEDWTILPKENNKYINTLIWDGNNKIISYKFNGNLIYSSQDLGQSWSLDNTFNDFSVIYSIIYNGIGGIVVQGKKQNLLNVYISVDGVNFNPIQANYFKDKYIYFIELSKPYLAAISPLSGAYLSNDNGINWEDISSGLNIFDSLITGIKSIYIDKDEYGYLSVESDGLYKSINPIVGVFEINNETLNGKVYPNPFNKELIISFTNHMYSELTFELFDSFAKLIYKKQDIQGREQIQLADNILYGIYYYRLSKYGKIVSAGKLIKI